MVLIIICIFIILFGGIVISLYTTYNDEKAYNKGICPKCRKKLEKISEDDCSVKFKCDCGYQCNISKRFL